jgi:hypothetical protein
MVPMFTDMCSRKMIKYSDIKDSDMVVSYYDVIENHDPDLIFIFNIIDHIGLQ